MAGMGLNTGFAAATIPGTLESLLKQRLLERESQQRQMQLALQQQNQMAQQEVDRGNLGVSQGALAVNQRRQGLSEREYEDAGPKRAEDLRTSQLDNSGRARRLGAQDELLKDPKFNPIIRATMAGVPVEGVNMEETPDEIQRRSLERIRAQGDQNVRSANASAQRAMSGVMPIQTVDEQGNPIIRVVPRAEAAGQTYQGRLPAEQQNRAFAARRASSVIDSIDELSRRINTAVGTLANIKGTAEKVAAKANLDDDVSEYQALVSGFTPLLARAVGHVGVLTELDVQSVKNMLPQINDSKNVRDRKMARIRTIWQSMNTAGRAGQDDAPDSGTLPGGISIADIDAEIARRKGKP